MAVSLVQWPSYALIQRLDWGNCLLGNVSHDGMHHLALIVSLLTLDDIFWGYPALRKIDLSCVAVSQMAPGWVLNNTPVPFSLSTLSTTTTSLRPTLMSFWILRIRRLESSERRIMPSMLSYSS